MGEIDYEALSFELEKNNDRPAIINVNIGTTVKGAVDNLDRIIRILHAQGFTRDRFHIHCDGALFAMMMPFIECDCQPISLSVSVTRRLDRYEGDALSFKKPIDSIAVSGHKMLCVSYPYIVFCEAQS